MFRRTKLILTAAFLGLLGIPAVYVALTWHLQNPLTFRILSVEDRPASLDSDEMYSSIEVEVTNTSATPVKLWFARLYRGDGPATLAVGSMDGSDGTVIEGHLDEDHMLSGGGRFRFNAKTRWLKSAPLDHNHLRVEYQFATRTKWGLWSLYSSLCRLLPEARHERGQLPEFSRGVAPLEPRLRKDPSTSTP